MTLTLNVVEGIIDIREFNFLIFIVGAENPVGDLNGNGKIDLYDLVIIARVYKSTSSDMDWRPDADLNGDGIIDISDCYLLRSGYVVL